jgi:hypothetical protein
MAQIDPSIPMGVRPPQVDAPMNQLLQLTQMQGAQQQNALLGLKMQEAQRAQADDLAMRTALADPAADPAKILLQRGKVAESVAYTKGQRENDKARVELIDAKLKQSRAFLDNVTTPEQYIAWHQANHADPILGPELAAHGVTPEQTMATVQQALQTPGGFQDLLRKSALGLERFTEMNKPTTTVVPAGGTSTVFQTPGLGGTPQVVANVAHTATPGETMTDERTRAANAELARHHGVQEQQGSAAISKPFEVTDPITGKAMLVQQDKAGNITPVPGYAPKGGGKPLPQSALKDISEVRDNAITIDRLTNSFKPDFAGKGVLGFGADAQLAASGVVGADKDAVEWWKNYRKQAELVERHALFGAALTPGEQRSWQSADISPGMDPEVIQRNLATRNALAKQVLEFKRQDLIDAGHSEERVNAIAGRRPGSTPTSTPPATAPTGQVYRVTTAADYDKVPKGAVYTTPDGQTRRKP